MISEGATMRPLLPMFFLITTLTGSALAQDSAVQAPSGDRQPAPGYGGYDGRAEVFVTGFGLFSSQVNGSGVGEQATQAGGASAGYRFHLSSSSALEHLQFRVRTFSWICLPLLARPFARSWVVREPGPPPSAAANDAESETNVARIKKGKRNVEIYIRHVWLSACRDLQWSRRAGPDSETEEHFATE